MSRSHKPRYRYFHSYSMWQLVTPLHGEDLYSWPMAYTPHDGRFSYFPRGTF